jgi:hypothetical protein
MNTSRSFLSSHHQLAWQSALSGSAGSQWFSFLSHREIYLLVVGAVGQVNLQGRWVGCVGLKPVDDTVFFYQNIP